MDDCFLIQGNISILRNSVPIRFVHRKNTDTPENHKLHINNYLEVYVYVQGNHQYMVENKIYSLQRGDIILISPREVHKALPLESCMYERFYLLVDERCFDDFVYNPLSALLKPCANMENLISPQPEIRKRILDLLYGISDCFTKDENRQTQALGLVLQLLDLCIRQRMHTAPSENAVASVPQLLEKILFYVAENTASIQSTVQIADALGISSQYLSSYFSKHIGTPLSVYVQTKKIALAKDLLDQGADVTGACFESGFNDCSYFIRIFKKHVGVTPLRYQQALSK